jgi:hypothetical protein
VLNQSDRERQKEHLTRGLKLKVDSEQRLIEKEFIESNFKKYRVLYDTFKMTKHGAIMFHLVYILRRIALILMALFANDYPAAQTFVFAISSISYAIFLTWQHPFIAWMTNFIEIVNELHVLLLSCFCSALLAARGDQRLVIGRFLQVIVLMMILFNSVIMVTNMRTTIKTFLHNYYKRRYIRDELKRALMRNKKIKS